MYDSERELWVVDTSITGMRKLPRSCFYYNDGLPNDKNNYYIKNDFGWDEPLHSDSFKRRPCEMGRITNFIIERNLKKIKDEGKIN